MSPVTFECQQLIPYSEVQLRAVIADTERWREFQGYGFLPGIESATYEKRTEAMVGSRIRVRNRDGSGHVEEIYRWAVGEGVAMKFTEFTPPLNQLATHFTEEWSFQSAGNGSTQVTRKFQLFPLRATTRPILWLIALVLKQAIAKNLREMAEPK